MTDDLTTTGEAQAPLDPRFLAGVQLLERTGARTFRIGHSDPDEGDDGEPVVWYAVARWLIGLNGRPVPEGPTPGVAHYESAAGMHPVTAVLRLCERMIDGGTCTHCNRPTIFLADADNAGPLDRMGCVYQWDPELATFRRTCEGDQP